MIKYRARRRSDLLAIYFTVFIDVLGLGIILPALPFYAIKFNATGVWVGAILTAYSLAQFVSAPLLGRISDRVGRRPVLVVSLVGSSVALTLTGIAPSLPWLLGARTLAGLFGGAIGPSQAYIADATNPAARAQALGLLGATIGLGFVAGPAIGALLSQFGFSTAAFVSAGLALANAAFTARVVRHYPPLRRAKSWPAVTTIIRRPTICATLLGILLTTMAFAVLQGAFALLGSRLWDLDQGGLGWMLAFAGMVSVATQSGLIGHAVKRWGEPIVATAGGILMATALALLPVAPNVWVATAFVGLLALGQGLATTALSAILSHTAEADTQGSTLGLGQSAAAAARAAGPALGGGLFDMHFAAPFAAAAASAGLASVISMRAARNR